MDKYNKGNLFAEIKRPQNSFEVFESLAETDSVLVERIISAGQITPEGKWLEQERNEWVLLIEGSASLAFESGEQFDLESGDYVLIPKAAKHKITYTSEDPPCIWLAFHFE
jgi:cupin 2 domain-containing protein